MKEAIGCYKAARALADSEDGIENEMGRNYNCLKDWRVGRRERARLELSGKSTSDGGNSKFQRGAVRVRQRQRAQLLEKRCKSTNY